ncbi:Uncharacterised protein [Chlamydia abortus]|nr:Uncharacterised protein [Chlamydia abortus]
MISWDHTGMDGKEVALCDYIRSSFSSLPIESLNHWTIGANDGPGEDKANMSHPGR